MAGNGRIPLAKAPHLPPGFIIVEADKFKTEFSELVPKRVALSFDEKAAAEKVNAAPGKSMNFGRVFHGIRG